jgi:hypothetical protein
MRGTGAANVAELVKKNKGRACPRQSPKIFGDVHPPPFVKHIIS